MAHRSLQDNVALDEALRSAARTTNEIGVLRLSFVAMRHDPLRMHGERVVRPVFEVDGSSRRNAQRASLRAYPCAVWQTPRINS
jgi:hypothetical protein